MKSKDYFYRLEDIMSEAIKEERKYNGNIQIYIGRYPSSLKLYKIIVLNDLRDRYDLYCSWDIHIDYNPYKSDDTNTYNGLSMYINITTYKGFKNTIPVDYTMDGESLRYWLDTHKLPRYGCRGLLVDNWVPFHTADDRIKNIFQDIYIDKELEYLIEIFTSLMDMVFKHDVYYNYYISLHSDSYYKARMSEEEFKW